MKEMMLRLWKDEEGPTAVEYALMLVLVALAIALVLPGLGDAVLNVFTTMTNNLTVAGGG